MDVEKKTPILPAKKHRPSGASEKELVGKKELSRFTAWPKLDDCVVVEPVIKPPHKRSKVGALEHILLLPGIFLSIRANTVYFFVSCS